MYINSERESVNSQDFVTEKEMIQTICKIYPHIIFVDLLCCDYFNYIATIPEHYNDLILRGIERHFPHLIENNFIEVVEDGSFDYEYGDICSTHNCTVRVGYVPRTPEFEQIAIIHPWEDDDFY